MFLVYCPLQCVCALCNFSYSCTTMFQKYSQENFRNNPCALSCVLFWAAWENVHCPAWKWISFLSTVSTWHIGAAMLVIVQCLYLSNPNSGKHSSECWQLVPEASCAKAFFKWKDEVVDLGKWQRLQKDGPYGGLLLECTFILLQCILVIIFN